MTTLLLYLIPRVGITNASQVEESCKVENMFRTSWPRSDDSNISCKDVHNELAYGFELSWLERNCESYCARYSHYCYLDDANHIQCISTGLLKRILYQLLGEVSILKTCLKVVYVMFLHSILTPCSKNCLGDSLCGDRFDM
ncbi:hypothetical protein CFP56_042154 [Quercus suber]|uniref:Apple domain-containing protein n=1 Tax=Quercus suber TaxID=58331 RepID=A0AAW0MBT6_QUESU